MNPVAKFTPAALLRAAAATIGLLLVSTTASPANSHPPENPAPSSRPDARLPGIALSQGVTEITGVAISPLLGVSAVGAWRYTTSTREQRKQLPWYAQPWFWGSGLAIISLCLLKDSLGTAVPGPLKKPFDVLELFENKASALLAAGAFVPLVASEMAASMDDGSAASVPTGSVLGPGVAFIDPAWWMIPASVTAFAVVWLCSHAIHVLIILSPFSTLDALLKLFKAAVLSGLALLYALAPWLAAVLCLVLIALAAWLAPSALRLLVLGAHCSSDLVLHRRARSKARHDTPHAFSFRSFGKVPARSLGRISLSPDGARVFTYQTWIVAGRRSVSLPDGMLEVEKGMITPSISIHTDAGERKFLLLPRHRGSEQRVADALGAASVKEHPVKRGLKAMMLWIKGLGRARTAKHHPG